MATPAKQPEKKSLSDRIGSFLGIAKTSAKKSDDEDDATAKKSDDEDTDAGKKADDSDEEMNKKGGDKSDDSQDDDDNLDNPNDDDDEDPYASVITEGVVYNMNNKEHRDAAIQELENALAAKEKIIAKQTGLLREAHAALNKKTETIKNEIKSTFVPQGSNRSTKATNEKPLPKWAKPKEGTLAANAAKQAIANAKKG